MSSPFTSSPLFRGAGLIINDQRYSFDLAEFPLHCVEVFSMVDCCPRCKLIPRAIFFRFVGYNRNALYTLVKGLMANLIDSKLAVDGLAAGHRNGVVE